MIAFKNDGKIIRLLCFPLNISILMCIHIYRYTEFNVYKHYIFYIIWYCNIPSSWYGNHLFFTLCSEKPLRLQWMAHHQQAMAQKPSLQWEEPCIECIAWRSGVLNLLTSALLEQNPPGRHGVPEPFARAGTPEKCWAASGRQPYMMAQKYVNQVLPARRCIS